MTKKAREDGWRRHLKMAKQNYDEADCPKCGRRLYRIGEYFTCPFHKKFKWDWVTKKLVAVRRSPPC